MAETLTLYQLPPSPNNIKIRLALGFKELAYESVVIPIQGYPPQAEERAEVVKISGQPLTPVLKHGSRAIFDSASILRYLDGHFPGPRLFSEDFGEMKEIETWESFGRHELPGPLNECFGQAVGGEEDTERLKRARDLLATLTARVEDRLARTGWLVSDRMTAADITAVPILHYSALPEDAAGQGPLFDFFARNLKLPAARDNVRGWIERVMAYDR